jgi:hypothetical protein
LEFGPAEQDVISPEYLEELTLLQDRIVPFLTDLGLQIIEQELGVMVEQLFYRDFTTANCCFFGTGISRHPSYLWLNQWLVLVVEMTGKKM